MEKYDVIVAGGGLAGVAAAVSAARENMKTLLLERYGFLGGAATAALVNPFMGFKGVNSGFFEEIIQKLKDYGAMHKNGVTFDEEILKLILADAVTENKIDLRLHSRAAAVKSSGGRLEEVVCAEKDGLKSYRGRFFIDATGDGDLSAFAGCEFQIGREEDGYCQPMTMCFRLSNVDFSKFDEKEMQERYKSFREKGLIKNPRENILWFVNVHDGVLHMNSTRIIKKSAISSKEFTEAELEARKQVFELYDFLRKNVDAFKYSYISSTAAQTGVRESRRIVGEYILTADDLLRTVHFEDSIARGTYPIDIHNPSGSGTVLKEIPKGTYYTIPYRSLIPKGKDNLLVAGRPISATHEAHSAYRIMPICTCIGQAAGIAASVAYKNNITAIQVPAGEIHDKLTGYNALF